MLQNQPNKRNKPPKTNQRQAISKQGKRVKTTDISVQEAVFQNRHSPSKAGILIYTFYPWPPVFRATFRLQFVTYEHVFLTFIQPFLTLSATLTRALVCTVHGCSITFDLSFFSAVLMVVLPHSPVHSQFARVLKFFHSPVSRGPKGHALHFWRLGEGKKYSTGAS